MLLGAWGVSLLGNLLTVKGISEKVKELQELVLETITVIIKWIFNTASSFNKLWNTKTLSKQTKI